MAIIRTVLGTISDKGTTATVFLNLTGGWTQGTIIICGLAADGILYGGVEMQFAASDYLALTRDAFSQNSGNVDVAIHRLADTSHASVSWGGTYPRLRFGEDFSDAKAGWAIKLEGIVNALDKSSTGSGSGTAPDSGTSGTLTQSDEIAIGCVGREDAGDDPMGTWTNSLPAAFTAGQQIGTTGGGDSGNITIQEGYYQTSATTAVQAIMNGADSADWAACVVTYKAITAGGPAGLKTLEGLAKAGVKTIHGQAIAGVKTVQGLARKLFIPKEPKIRIPLTAIVFPEIVTSRVIIPQGLP